MSDLAIVVKAMRLMQIKYPDIELLNISIFDDESYGFKAKGLNSEKHAEIFDADYHGIDSLVCFCNRFIEENSGLLSNSPLTD